MFLGSYNRGTPVVFVTANPGPAFVSSNGQAFLAGPTLLAASGLAGYFIGVLTARETGTLGLVTIVVQGGASDEVFTLQVRNLIDEFSQKSRTMQVQTNENTTTTIDDSMASLTRRLGDIELQLKKLAQAKTS